MRSLLLVFFLCMTLLPLPARGADALAGFPDYLASVMKSRNIPGAAIAVVREGRPTRFFSAGVRRTGTEEAVDPDTIFQIGSTSKAFTTALTAMLVDEGKLDWSDQVTGHLDEFRMADPWVTREFTVIDLYAQRSGMPSYAGDLQGFLGYGRDHLVRSLRYIEPIYSFRSEFSYVNNLFVAGAAMMEAITGQRWEDAVSARILTPLGMTRSSTDEAGLLDDPNHAALHLMGKTGPQVIEPGSILSTWPYVNGPAGGLNSTARDMSRWLQLQMQNGSFEGKRLFSEESAMVMHSPKTPMQVFGVDAAYCLGWVKLFFPTHTVISHNGATLGAGSFAGWSPEAKAGVVVLTNMSRQNGADALGFWVLDRLAGAPQRDWSAELSEDGEQDEQPEMASRSALPLANYTGEYDNPVYGPLQVRREDAGLRIHFGKDLAVSLRLRHAGGDSFTASWPEMDPDDPIHLFDFAVNAEGKVASVSFRDFNEDGLAVWERVVIDE